MNILTVESLRKGFKPHFFSKQKQVLKNLSFTIQSGRTTGFIGVNGAGKTSTLKCVLGFTRPDHGTIRFFDGHALDNEVKSKIGYLPERPYYYDFLTAKEFLKFHWDLSGASSEGFESAADEVLTKVNLKNTGTKKLRSFSKGMLQRIGMAQALLHKPPPV
jgi:ABC-2 type transport system ATP-binding protein